MNKKVSINEEIEESDTYNGKFLQENFDEDLNSSSDFDEIKKLKQQ